VKNLSHYHTLADLFEYPDAEYPQKVRVVKHVLDARYPVAAEKLERFLGLLPESDLIAMQELFIRSFDVQAMTTLDIGYVLFGDDYKRGEMLANLNREHLEAKNDCGSELADHLSNILRLLSKLKDEELIEELAGSILAPALREMKGEFSAERIAKKNESYKKHYKTIIDTAFVPDEAITLYQFPLQALYEVLQQDFSLAEAAPSIHANDFLGSLRRENEIEAKAETAG
jgi:nitrate reductase assembly molybdenum cofactor insertion protein NarJ